MAASGATEVSVTLPDGAVISARFPQVAPEDVSTAWKPSEPKQRPRVSFNTGNE